MLYPNSGDADPQIEVSTPQIHPRHHRPGHQPHPGQKQRPLKPLLDFSEVHLPAICACFKPPCDILEVEGGVECPVVNNPLKEIFARKGE
jgi:hypothetical protein